MFISIAGRQVRAGVSRQEGPVLHGAPWTEVQGSKGTGVPMQEGRMRWRGDSKGNFPGTSWDDRVPYVEY